MNKKLQMSGLFDQLCSAASLFPDKREGKNIQYSLETFVMTAFSAFFTQCPSFNSHKALTDRLGENASNLFGLDRIPSHNQTRNVLGGVSPEYLVPVYDGVLRSPDRSGILRGFRGFEDDILIALDGAQYFSSKSISCENCSTKKHRNGRETYHHSVLMSAAVVPWDNTAIPLAPEFITPQDGSSKQDCEINAAKRWTDDFRRRHKKVSATLLGDDLYSRQPMCEEVLKNRLNFIFVCKPSSHPTLYKQLGIMEKDGDLKTKTVRRGDEGDHKTDIYKYANDVPLRYGDDALRADWAEITTVNETDGKVLYHNSFVTNHKITENNVEAVTAAGRCRWKTENENINTLKNNGYNLEHNYGHGGKFLSSLLASLILIAFLFHTILDIADGKYRMLRDILPSRKEFFNDIRALIRYLRFNSPESLLDFMISRLERNYAPG
ncbi:MAG: ISNCY family transposase [Desulfobacteraceae bacterium]|nr:ISNCY family transposase [Desulfobacteraceae bacterium]